MLFKVLLLINSSFKALCTNGLRPLRVVRNELKFIL